MADLEQPEADPGAATAGGLVHDLLQIAATETGTCVVLSLSGELDAETAPQLRQRVLDHMASGRRIIIDTTQLRFCGSAGLAVFIDAHNQARAHDVELRIVIPPGGLLQHVVQVVGLTDVLPLAPDLNSALQ